MPKLWMDWVCNIYLILMSVSRELLRRDGEAEGVTSELRLTERGRQVWDKGRRDGEEYMRQIYVREGYKARGARVQDTVPGRQDRERFLEQADQELGELSAEDDNIYTLSFNNACLAGYPPQDA